MIGTQGNSDHTIVEVDIAIHSIALLRTSTRGCRYTPLPSQASRPQGDECIDSVDLRKHLRYRHQGPKHAKGCPSSLHEGSRRVTCVLPNLPDSAPMLRGQAK